MATKRMSIPLSADEDSLLKRLYLVYRIPSDQYRRRPAAVARYLRDWHALSGRGDEWEDLCHYILTKRKQKEWPTLDGDYHPLSEPDWDLLTAGEWAALDEAYKTVVLSRQLGSDALLFDNSLAGQLAREFTRLTGRSLSGAVLASLIMSRRKRGEWAHLRQSDGDIGFGDIDEVA